MGTTPKPGEFFIPTRDNMKVCNIFVAQYAGIEENIDLGKGMKPVHKFKVGFPVRSRIAEIIFLYYYVEDDDVDRNFTRLDIENPQSTIKTELYWNCRCKEHYISPHWLRTCGRCGAEIVDRPNSTAYEVYKAGFNPATGRRLIFERRKKKLGSSKFSNLWNSI